MYKSYKYIYIYISHSKSNLVKSGATSRTMLCHFDERKLLDGAFGEESELTRILDKRLCIWVISYFGWEMELV